MVITVIKTGDIRNQEKKELDIVENGTIAEEAHNPPPIVRVARQTTIPANLEVVVLVTTKGGGLTQVDALPDWSFMHA